MYLQRLLAVSFLLLTTPVSFAQNPESIAGKWAGSWKNSLGESGHMVMELKSEDGKKFTGMWDDAVITSAKRVNKNTLQIDAKNNQHSYQITATISDDGVMHMKYQATHKTKGAYTGECKLEHKKK